MLKEQRVLILNRQTLQKNADDTYTASFVPADPTGCSWLDVFENWLQTKPTVFVEYGRATPPPGHLNAKESLNYIIETKEHLIGMCIKPPTLKETLENGEVGYTINFKAYGPMGFAIDKLIENKTEPFLICIKALVDTWFCKDGDSPAEDLKSIFGLHILPPSMLATRIHPERLKYCNPEMD